MPANDGHGSHVDHRIAPIEEPGEQRKADASHVIHASWFDTTLGISRGLSAKDQILSADRAGGTQERDARPQDVRDDSDDCLAPTAACAHHARLGLRLRVSDTEVPAARFIVGHRCLARPQRTSSMATLGLSTARAIGSARRRRRNIDKRQRFAVVFEFFAGRQLEVRFGFVEGESVCKTHRAPMVAASAVAFLQAQALEMIGSGAAIAASHLS